MATERAAPSSLDAASMAVLVAVRGTLRQLVQALEAACRQVGLTEPQQHALLCVADGEGNGRTVTATDLSTHLATDKNTVADILRRLEGHGLLDRERRGRAVVLRLTPAGRAHFHASLATIGRALGEPGVATAAARLPGLLASYLAIYQAVSTDVGSARTASPTAT